MAEALLQHLALSSATRGGRVPGCITFADRAGSHRRFSVDE
jgi:hypothetical protein